MSREGKEGRPAEERNVDETGKKSYIIFNENERGRNGFDGDS